MNELNRAIDTYRILTEQFYLPDAQLYLEHAPPTPEDHPVSYLWPYSGVLSAVNALTHLPGVGRDYHGELIRVIDGLKHYYDDGASIPAYDSYIRSAGGGPKFYDDNEWLGLDFVEAYRTLGNPAYLQAAKDMFAFAISGWTEELGGGIFWRQTDRDTKNTCSNGPAALLGLKLYQETDDPKYLDSAKRILEWTQCLFDPESGVYFDHFRIDGTLDKRTYTYNAGTLIHSNVLLYQITNEKPYLDTAERLAKCSYEHFAKKHEETPFPMFPDTPWFNAVLLRAYLALYQVSPNDALVYVNAMRSNVDYAFEHSRDDTGLFSPDWTGKTGVHDKNKWLLDQAAMVEIYALLATHTI